MYICDKSQVMLSHIPSSEEGGSRSNDVDAKGYGVERSF